MPVRVNSSSVSFETRVGVVNPDGGMKPTEEPIEEVDPTPEDLEELADETVAIAIDAGKARYKRKKKKEPFRRSIKLKLEDINHALVGPPCKVVPTPQVIEDFLEEFADLFTDELPKVLPPSRPTYHRIDLKPGFKPPARRAYRMAPQEEGTLRETLNDLL